MSDIEISGFDNYEEVKQTKGEATNESQRDSGNFAHLKFLQLIMGKSMSNRPNINREDSFLPKDLGISSSSSSSSSSTSTENSPSRNSDPRLSPHMTRTDHGHIDEEDKSLVDKMEKKLSKRVSRLK